MASDKQKGFVEEVEGLVMEEDSSDDFVIIEKIGENTSVRSPVTPNTPTSETDSGYEDFVELSFEDVKEVINHCWILICKIIIL